MTRQGARSFEELEVWQEAHAFVLGVYRHTQSYPRLEQFGLISQFRRAAVYIPANIAEGFRKRSDTDKVRIYNIAQGSAEECRYYCILARDLGYGDTRELSEQTDRVCRMLDGYIRAILSD